MFGSSSPESLSHTIQVALTPVFLLSAIATLLNVFSTRLGRIADQVDRLAGELRHAQQPASPRQAAELGFLRRRSKLLDGAVALGALGAGFDCVAALTLFVGTLRAKAVSSILFATFGLAIVCAIVALALYLGETLLAGRGLRASVDAHGGGSRDTGAKA